MESGAELSRPEVFVLRRLGAAGRSTVSGLSSNAGLPMSTASWLVDRLVRRGYLRRRRATRDRRVVMLELSPRGRETLREYDRIYERIAREMLRGLSQDEQEEIIELSQKMLDAGGEVVARKKAAVSRRR